jgi:hypothetical protein
MLAFIALLAISYKAEPVVTWTKDGRWLVYPDRCITDGCPGGWQVHAQDVRTGDVVSFEEAAEMSDDEVEAKLAAWTKVHPTVEVKASRVSPDGKGSAEVELTKQALAGTWSGGTWTSGGGTEWVFAVKRDGKSRRTATSSGGEWVRVYWSPDGKRILWEIEQGGHGMRDPGYEEQIFGPANGPSISLSIGAPDQKRAAEMADLLEAKGYVITETLKAKATRPKSAVLAHPGFEAVAAEIAKLIPGGASIEKLDAGSDRDLIIAVGKSALGGK